MRTRRQLFQSGLVHIEYWCTLNDVPAPKVVESDEPKQFNTCAYYRDDVITICVNECANIGMNGRAWSFPGYVVDRTPYGVLAHELGHHVDCAFGPGEGVYGTRLRTETNEKPITTYCDNDDEWFAEIFRLFVTNPDLLEKIRPKVYAILIDLYPKRAEPRDWTIILALAPRQMAAAENKMKQALRPKPGRLF